MAAYIPSLGFCQSHVDDLLPQAIEIYSGDARDLHLLDREVAAIDSLESSTVDGLNFLSPGSRYVHFAGHGAGNGPPAERSLALGGEDITVPRILREADYVGVELVTLSACSTGAFSQESAAPMELGGVDFALIAVGAKCAVSTMWNVHDSASALFMSALHAGLSIGNTIQASFINAQRLLRFGEGSPDVEVVLQRLWPRWQDEIMIDTRSAVHWGAFRLAGRYW